MNNKTLTFLIIGTMIFLFSCNQKTGKTETIEVSYVEWACDCANFIEIKYFFNNPDYEIKEEDCIFIESANNTVKIPDTYFTEGHFNYNIKLTGQFYINKSIPKSYQQKTAEKPLAAKIFYYDKYELVKKHDSVSTDLEQTENNITVISKQSQFDISNVSEKIQKQEELTIPDYDCICDFLFNNNDDSKSEEIGYLLFEYLKSNPSNNSAFASYLDKKDVSFHDKVQKALVQIMCIDIGEENYTFDTFVKDFDMFKNSISAKNAFDECMSNQ